MTVRAASCGTYPTFADINEDRAATSAFQQATVQDAGQWLLDHGWKMMAPGVPSSKAGQLAVLDTLGFLGVALVVRVGTIPIVDRRRHSARTAMSGSRRQNEMAGVLRAQGRPESSRRRTVWAVPVRVLSTAPAGPDPGVSRVTTRLTSWHSEAVLTRPRSRGPDGPRDRLVRRFQVLRIGSGGKRAVAAILDGQPLETNS